MKTVTKTVFLAAIEAEDIAWPPIVVGSHVYGLHNSSELWRAQV